MLTVAQDGHAGGSGCFGGVHLATALAALDDQDALAQTRVGLHQTLKIWEMLDSYDRSHRG